MSVWNTSMHTAASMVERNRVMMEGTLRAIMTPVSTGTTSTQGEMWNRSASVSVNAIISAGVPGSCIRPATRNTARLVAIEGIVVNNM